MRYRKKDGRFRTPVHLDWVVDLYMKKACDARRTEAFVNRLRTIAAAARPATQYPPKFQLFDPLCKSYTSSDGRVRFDVLSDYGEYTVEFPLAVVELLIIEEKTNYAQESLIEALLDALQHADIFKTVRIARMQLRRPT